MVRLDGGGQLYTMEGVAAGLIMVLTAYLVLGSTSVYTPGDTHITDMQLEQVGSDVLKVMDTPQRLGEKSELQEVVESTDSTAFDQAFWHNYLYNPQIVAKSTTRSGSALFYNATVWYKRSDGSLGSYPLSSSPISYGGKEPGVVVTRWVQVETRPTGLPADVTPRVRNERQVMLVEVLLWKV